MVLYMTREPVRFCGAPAVLVTALDVTDTVSATTERKQLERRLAEAQRLDGLGLMAGGIAHDFNNLLVGVLGNAELSLLETKPGSRTHDFLERIRTAAGRLADLAHQMLTYSGHSPTRLQPVDLGAIAREMVELIASSVPAQIQVALDVPDQLPAVAGDAAQLGQVVVNLVLNAAEAIGDKPGRIRVLARREFLDSTRTASLTLRSVRGPADYLCFEVADDGPGIDEATRLRIFDPFFSTKEKRGRGLGLASVIGIVRAHQGALQVDSQLGKGTRMRIWLPLAAEIARAQPKQPKRPRSASPRGRRVLIVDDEAVVRETASALLEAQGFTTLASWDAETALACAKNAGGAIDAVMLDLTIPGCSAEDLHGRLRSLLPDAGILLVSGYSEPSVLRRLLERPRTRFLEKPFTAEALSTQLEALLARA
jgi:signal transduction histidine kinase